MVPLDSFLSGQMPRLLKDDAKEPWYHYLSKAEQEKLVIGRAIWNDLVDMQTNYFSMREETRRLENKLRPRLDNWIRVSHIRKQLIKCATKRMTKCKAMKATAKTVTKTKAMKPKAKTAAKTKVMKATATTQGQRQRWFFS